MFDLLIFILGIVYGYITHGQEDKVRLLRNGLMLAVGAGIGFGGISITYKGLAGFGATFVMAVYWISLLTVIFVGGTVIGDFIERKIKR
jgi:drug/metabolite transporter (DMT)-like permease